MNKHSPLQSCWSRKASACAKQRQYTSILPPVLMPFLPATNVSALNLQSGSTQSNTDKLNNSAGVLLTGIQETSSFLVHVLTLHELLHRFCIYSWSHRLQKCLLNYMFSFGWFLLEYTTFHCLAFESQLHKKNNAGFFTVLKNVLYPLALMMIFFSCSRNRRYSVESFTSDTCSAHLFPCLLSHLSSGFPLDLTNTVLQELGLLLWGLSLQTPSE